MASLPLGVRPAIFSVGIGIVFSARDSSAMRQRQQAIAGTLEINRAGGRGAASLVSVPLDRGARS
jgi:hypothetical protein